MISGPAAYQTALEYAAYAQDYQARAEALGSPEEGLTAAGAMFASLAQSSAQIAVAYAAIAQAAAVALRPVKPAEMSENDREERYNWRAVATDG